MEGGTSGRERNWLRLRHDDRLRRNLEIRAGVLGGIRDFFDREGFLEIDPPALVPLPGMEPHLAPLSAPVRDPRGEERRFYLHTSPEYCLKKLLAGGLERVYSLGHVYRNGEISATHNPEYMLLEWYRTGVDYRALMADCEDLMLHVLALSGCELRVPYRDGELNFSPPWPRISLKEAMQEHADVDLDEVRAPEELLRKTREKGYSDANETWPWEDLFYRIFLQEVEPRLPLDRPFFLVDYPEEMAALARAKKDAPRWVERFELYAGGLELANAFSELTDPSEQRRRLIREQRQRAEAGQETYPVDLSFLEALEKGMPEAAGIALGVDRVVMLLANAPDIRDVLPFPMEDLLADWEKARGDGQ